MASKVDKKREEWSRRASGEDAAARETRQDGSSRENNLGSSSSPFGFLTRDQTLAGEPANRGLESRVGKCWCLPPHLHLLSPSPPPVFTEQSRGGKEKI